MLNLSSINAMHLDAIREIGSIGAGNAATAMSALLGYQVRIDIPKAELVSIYELDSYYDDPDSVYTAVFASSSNEDPFNFMLLVKESEVGKLVSLLIAKQFGMEMDADSLTSDMLDSALGEIGNIMLGSFLNAVNGLLGVSSGMTTPSVTHDMLASILSIVSAMFGEYGDIALVTKSNVVVGTGENVNSLDANILLASGPKALETLLVKIGVM
ncbi:MAG: chemotaxis protein CheC [Synergistaceae bacterium]|nr:chemotaxis protein CheC [Synergistaceae bacterium]